MPLPDGLARFNQRVTNRITGPFARWLPGFGVVVHRGRASGREYQAPVNAFRHGDGIVIALTYGADRDWVRNVVAAGGCEMLRRGRTIELTRPAIVAGAPALALVPAPVRWILGRLAVTEVMTLERGPACA
jgi:deazaflavin-dependent oxidoreductase (nitroreductase family)